MYSFINNFTASFAGKIFIIFSVILILIFVLIWLLNLRREWQKNTDVIGPVPLSGAEIGLIGMSFQLMSLLPTISHDYQLIIQIIPFIIVLYSEKSFKLDPEHWIFLIIALSISIGFMFAPRSESMIAIKAIPLLFNYAIFAFLALNSKDEFSDSSKIA